MKHLVDKDDIVAEIERRIKTLNERLIKRPISSPTLEKLIEENKKVLFFLNTLEVKEVDLDKEVNAFIDNEMKFLSDEVGYDTLSTIARHFFELGLKAQKGEITISKDIEIIIDNVRHKLVKGSHTTCGNCSIKEYCTRGAEKDAFICFRLSGRMNYHFEKEELKKK